ncbi:response regulator transcription factor [Clostridium estertheticum]|uniref:response regulator transcription factor n=1 Tax=Clostridium estertheticum TaxID=238834 RepID=UPI001C0C7510|nr:response regulator transcription factor [Clostridium estertheticum]MBU3076027.1 response regulator transcription factor [Clostridium estertheticum]MBU3166147.1 response regulator transcription factor [Clostridium estertheticum]MBU3187588.1 response regulator transcription factor [Clostridium estertheticum]
MGKYTVLIIDDEQEIVELIEIYLINEGYQVFKAFNGAEGLEVLANQKIDLIVLDIMMPGVDGMETCRRIRQQMYLPIIMLSAKSEDMDRILGLGLGADDYLSKPFNPMELIARIKSQLRRYFNFNLHNQLNCDDNVIHIKDLVINKNNHSVSVYNKDANLTPTEYEILLLLASNSGIVFSAEKIFEKVWNEKYYESKNTVMVHIWRLREKVEKIPKEPKIIETVWGVGYKIEK